LNSYMKRSVVGILRVSIVRRGTRSLGELRSSGEAEVRTGHASEVTGKDINVDFYVAMSECV